MRNLLLFLCLIVSQLAFGRDIGSTHYCAPNMSTENYNLNQIVVIYEKKARLAAMAALGQEGQIKILFMATQVGNEKGEGISLMFGERSAMSLLIIMKGEKFDVAFFVFQDDRNVYDTIELHRSIKGPDRDFAIYANPDYCGYRPTEAQLRRHLPFRQSVPVKRPRATIAPPSPPSLAPGGYSPKTR